MNQRKPEEDIGALAGAAGASIRQQQDKAATAAAAPAKPPVAKRMLASLLLLAFVGVAWVQYPSFHEPFGRPDPRLDSTVAEADLNVLATLLESYRLAQGKYPASLEQVRLPESVTAFVAKEKIAYRQTERAYVLDWTLPRWHAVFDGETGKVTLSPSAK